MTIFSQLDITFKNVKSPINVIAYSNILSYVAVGRHDGIVEIYDYSQNFLFLCKIIVCNINPIDGLKFMNFKDSAKLFGISSSKLFEIDLSKNSIKQALSLNSDYARSIVQAGDKICIGCDNGYINIYEYISEIKLSNTIGNFTDSILSLAHSKHWKNHLFAGSQGQLYKINMSDSNNTEYYKFTKEKNRSPTYIWCLEFIGKHLCSGDSKGVVTIWNAGSFGPMQTFQTHKADVLTIAVGVNCIFVSGSDPQLVKLELVADKWIEGSKRQGIVGDVRSLCCTEKKLLAGGLNCSLLAYDLHPNQADRSDKHMKIDDIAPMCELHSFDDQSMVLFMEMSKSIKVYQINMKSNTKSLLRSVKPPKENHLQAWSASQSLRHLAYSTVSETRILKMQFTNGQKQSLSMNLKRFNGGEFSNSHKPTGLSVSLPASILLKFVEMGNRTFLLLVEAFVTGIVKSDNNSKLLIYELIDDSTSPILITSLLVKEENYFNNIHKIEVSADGRLIAFSTLDGLLFVYSLERLAIVKKVAAQCNANRKDIARVVCMRFSVDATNLAVVYSNKKLWKMDLKCKDKSAADKWYNKFNGNLCHEWTNLTARDIDFIDDKRLVVLMTRGLIVQVNGEKEPIVPNNVPLFTKRKIAQQVKEKSLRVEIVICLKNIKKMNKIIKEFEHSKDDESLKSYEKRLNRYETKLKKLQGGVDTTVDTCFTWDFVNKGTVIIRHLPTQKRLVCVSLDEADHRDFTYKRKFFGL